MGLFDIFKQKKKSAIVEQLSDSQFKIIPGTEEMELTELMKNALEQPAYNPSFYHRMLTEELIVISMTPNVDEGYHYLKEGTSVELYSLPDGTIPIFTAVKRIFDKGIVKEDVQFLQMTGADLFSLTRGSAFVLNPYSDYRKEILAEEIECLLDIAM